MQSVLFTNSNYIKSVTPIDDNMGDKFILPALQQAQNEDYRCIIGDSLYNKLAELVKDETIAEEENEAYKELLDRSQAYLAYATVIKLMPVVSFKLANIGLNRTHDDNIEYATMDDMWKMQDYFQHSLDHNKLQLQQYLLNNRNAFPELDECACNAISANLHASDSSAIFLGGARGRGINNRGYIGK